MSSDFILILLILIRSVASVREGQAPNPSSASSLPEATLVQEEEEQPHEGQRGSATSGVKPDFVDK